MTVALDGPLHLADALPPTRGLLPVTSSRGGTVQRLELWQGGHPSWLVNGATRGFAARGEEWRDSTPALLDTTCENRHTAGTGQLACGGEIVAHHLASS